MIYETDWRLKKGSSNRHKLWAFPGQTQRHFLLTLCHRQIGSDQVWFRSFLAAISTNADSIEIIIIFRKKKSCQKEYTMYQFLDASRFYSTKERVNVHNEECLDACGNPIANLPAKYNISIARDALRNRTNCLKMCTLHLVVDIMLRLSLWTEVSWIVSWAHSESFFNRWPPNLSVCIRIE